MNKHAPAWLECLQTNGYRLTVPRRTVVEIIAQSQCVLSPLEVFEMARARYPRLGLVTVYRTLEKLEELALIQRVHQPSGCHAFVAAATGHQHPIICQGCGKVDFLDGDKIDLLVSSDAIEKGYQIQDHWLQLFGMCADCRNKA